MYVAIVCLQIYILHLETIVHAYQKYYITKNNAKEILKPSNILIRFLLILFEVPTFIIHDFFWKKSKSFFLNPE